MADCGVADFSSVPSIAEFFHTCPHVNLDFDNVSSLFVPTLSDYQQVLSLYALGPSLLGALVFLIFCGHFLASCCSCDKEYRPRLKCVLTLQCVIFLAAVISVGFVIAAFVFNDAVNEGVEGVITAINNVNNSLLEIQSKVDSTKDYLLDMDSTLSDMRESAGIPEDGIILVEDLQDEISYMINSLVKIKKVSLPDVSGQILDIENYRWWTTFGTLFFCTLTCVLLIYAVLRQSRSGFVVAILLGMFCLLLVWMGVSLDFAAVIGMSDLCVNPKGTVYYYTRRVAALKNTGVVEFYVECPAGGENPYHQNVRQAIQHLTEAMRLLRVLVKQSWLPNNFKDPLFHCNEDLQQSQKNLIIIDKDLNCSYAHQQFSSAQCYICHFVVLNLAELLMVTLIIGVIFIVILSSVLPVFKRGHSRRCKRRNILDMCGSQTPLGTPYQSISETDERSESVPLVPSAPRLSGQDTVYRSVEFHSFEDSCRPALPKIPPKPVINWNPDYTSGEIRSMAF